MADIVSEIESAVAAAGGDWHNPPLVLAAYDTEFLGHGWKEGLYWLEVALRSLAASDTIRLTLRRRGGCTHFSTGPAPVGRKD